MIPVEETPAESTGEVDDLTPEQLAAQWEEEKPPAAGALANAAASLVVMGVGIGAVILSIAMGLGTPGKPQPGLWPFIISLVMVALGAFQLLAGRHNRDAEKFTRMSTAPLTGLVTLVAMVALMPLIGFELPSLVLCRLGARGNHRHPASAHLQRRARHRHHHAGRHLLRRPVRRHHHLRTPAASR